MFPEAKYTKQECPSADVVVTECKTAAVARIVRYVVSRRSGTELTDLQKPEAIEAINNANLGGLGKALSSGNTEFRSGLPAEFTGSQVKIEPAESNTVNIVFEKQKAWSLFYEGTLTITPANGWIVTNTYIPETTDIIVTKEWEHNGNNNAPSSVQVQLYADEEAVGTPVFISEDEAGNWQVTFEDLPKYYNDNTEIQYTVQEVNVPEGYESEVEEEDKGVFVITNTYTSTGEPEEEPEKKPIRDTVTIEIGNNGKLQEANPDTGAPVFTGAVLGALAAAR